MSNEYTLSEPESYEVPAAENRFVYIEGTGEFKTIAPKLWDEFNTQLRSDIPGANEAVRWNTARPDGASSGSGHYRCGVVLNAPLPSNYALPANVKVGSISSGKYARFVMKGSYTHFGEAYEKAFAAVKRHDTMKLRPDAEVLESLLDGVDKTPENEHQTAIFLPVDVPSGKYHLSGPERRHLAATPNRFLHISGHGASIEEINPGNLWMKFHSEVMPQVPQAHKEGVTMWATACTNVKGKGTAVYRCGALLSKPTDLKHIIPKGSHAHLSELPEGDYVMFEMTGWFDGLGQAYPEAIQRAKDAGFVVQEHEDFLETYLTDPMTTPYDSNRTEIYIPVEASSPTRKHRTEQPSG
jgi:DNA gyrase inhibitor GyrI